MAGERKKLVEDFKESPIMMGDYVSFFNNLLQLIDGKTVNHDMGNEISAYVREFIISNSIKAETYSTSNYVRNYIGRDEDSGWEAILMAWSKGNTTSIHSHPEFASYSFCEGEFLVETFEAADDPSQAIKINEIIINGNESFFSIGEKGKFDNHLHRISCLSDTGLSIHIYSDDALKGYKFEEVK